MKINKNKQMNNISQQNWEQILKKNSFQGHKVNRLAKAASNLDSDQFNYNSQTQILSFQNYKINLYNISSNNNTFSLSRLKHRLKLKLFGSYKEKHNKEIKHLAEIIKQKLQLEQQPKATQQRSSYLFRGTQAGCQGSVTIEKVEAIRARLEAEAAFGITFNSSKVKDTVEGGACSAMSLDFIDSYFKTKSICKEEPNYRSSLLLEKIRLNGTLFAKSSQQMKDLQAAFNTIEVLPSETPIDYSKNKVQSLANYYFLEINHSSKEIDTSTISNTQDIAKEVDELPKGVFLIRIIKPEDNDKLETQGHSMVFIKEEGVCLFYDPNFGVRDLSSDDDPSKALFNNFKLCLQTFKISKARFYQVQPSEEYTQTS